MVLPAGSVSGAVVLPAGPLTGVVVAAVGGSGPWVSDVLHGARSPLRHAGARFLQIHHQPE